MRIVANGSLVVGQDEVLRPGVVAGVLAPVRLVVAVQRFHGIGHVGGGVQSKEGARVVGRGRMPRPADAVGHAVGCIEGHHRAVVGNHCDGERMLPGTAAGPYPHALKRDGDRHRAAFVHDAWNGPVRRERRAERLLVHSSRHPTTVAPPAHVRPAADERHRMPWDGRSDDVELIGGPHQVAERGARAGYRRVR